MAAVRNAKRLELGKITVRFHVRPPTDVIAITSLPIAAPGGRWLVSIQPSTQSSIQSSIQPSFVCSIPPPP